MKLLKSILLFLTIISCSTSSNKKADDFSALIDLEGNAFNLDDLKGNILKEKNLAECGFKNQYNFSFNYIFIM